MSEHAKEPWRIGAMESGRVAIDDANGEEVTGWIDPEDARRIIACVNALEGLNDHALAGGWSFKGISAYVNSILAQRKQLLDVADAIDKCLAAAGVDAVADSDNPIEDLRHRAQAAIAVCRGEP